MFHKHVFRFGEHWKVIRWIRPLKRLCKTFYSCILRNIPLCETLLQIKEKQVLYYFCTKGFWSYTWSTASSGKTILIADLCSITLPPSQKKKEICYSWDIAVRRSSVHCSRSVPCITGKVHLSWSWKINILCLLPMTEWLS